jgi:hypothetical protein
VNERNSKVFHHCEEEERLLNQDWWGRSQETCKRLGCVREKLSSSLPNMLNNYQLFFTTYFPTRTVIVTMHNWMSAMGALMFEGKASPNPT